VQAYEETPEDRALTNPFRMYNGLKIDIRWSGGWLTPDGDYHPVDYKNGITHETIANEHGSSIWGSGSIMTRPPIMRIFDIAEWMRIAYLESSSFCVELKGSLVGNIVSASDKNEEELYQYNHGRQSVLLRFVRDFKEFDSYFINDVQHNTFRQFVAAIGQNNVEPTRADDDDRGPMGFLPGFLP
jgi:hypothetical protein